MTTTTMTVYRHQDVAHILQDAYHYALRAAGTGDEFNDIPRGEALRRAVKKARAADMRSVRPVQLGLLAQHPRFFVEPTNLKDPAALTDLVQRIAGFAASLSIDANTGLVDPKGHYYEFPNEHGRMVEVGKK